MCFLRMAFWRRGLATNRVNLARILILLNSVTYFTLTLVHLACLPIDEFKRLKIDEGKSLGAPWSIRREMAKINTAILDQAIRERLVPPQLAFTKKEQAFFASEKDMINLIVFGMTAREWKKSNPIKKGNQRDHATTDELTVIANLESLDARLLKWDCERPLREDILMQTAIDQFSILGNNKAAKRLQATLDKQDGLLE